MTGVHSRWPLECIKSGTVHQRGNEEQAKMKPTIGQCSMQSCFNQLTGPFKVVCTNGKIHKPLQTPRSPPNSPAGKLSPRFQLPDWLLYSMLVNACCTWRFASFIFDSQYTIRLREELFMVENTSYKKNRALCQAHSQAHETHPSPSRRNICTHAQ